MSTSLVTVLLIVFAAVALFTVVMGIVLTVVVKTDDPSRGAKHTWRSEERRVGKECR